MNDNKFNYTYSAPTESERREIDSIRRQYQPKSQREISIERLRHLDSIVKGVPQSVALILGVVGILIFGLGLTMILLEWTHILWGALVMLIALPLIISAYPMYNKLLIKYKEKYGEEILQLSEELLKQD